MKQLWWLETVRKANRKATWTPDTKLISNRWIPSRTPHRRVMSRKSGRSMRLIVNCSEISQTMLALLCRRHLPLRASTVWCSIRTIKCQTQWTTRHSRKQPTIRTTTRTQRQEEYWVLWVCRSNKCLAARRPWTWEAVERAGTRMSRANQAISSSKPQLLVALRHLGPSWANTR